MKSTVNDTFDFDEIEKDKTEAKALTRSSTKIKQLV